jgi:DNA-3-methyladenine glycosylase I
MTRELLLVGADGRARCHWCGADRLYVQYHDEEWGRPVRHDARLFEKVCLEGFQSGLSWLTILRKRENFRRAFRGFDPVLVARFNKRSVERLLGDAGIVRHRGKIESAINNAKRALALIEERGSLRAFFADYAPASRDWPGEVSTSTESEALSRELRGRGWTFVGPTTLYACMQAMGIVNDHAPGCFRRGELERRRSMARWPT